MEIKYFPFETVRPYQKEFITKVTDAVENKRHLLVHAPTGLGKTAAALAPALEYAIKHEKTIFFLTSRHTQHAIAIDTLRAIKEKHNIPVHVVDLIGKKGMCLQSGVQSLRSADFFEYCKKLREDNACSYYSNTRSGQGLTTQAKAAQTKFKHLSPLHIEEFNTVCESEQLCPYEMASALSEGARVIIADYYYIYNERIRNQFFSKIGIGLSDVIVIVDEAHNLPERLRNLLSDSLAQTTVERARKEIDNIGAEKIRKEMDALAEFFEEIDSGLKLGDERMLRQEDLTDVFGGETKVEDFIALCDIFGDEVLNTEKTSAIKSVGNFLSSWLGPEEGFIRFCAKREGSQKALVSLMYRCMDPQILSRDVNDTAHSVILMSGTLQPTQMYRDILGFETDTDMLTFDSPFPQENRLNMIVPVTTTKYQRRSKEEFERIARVCAQISEKIPGNVAIFFPSYYLRDQVYDLFSQLCNKTCFCEKPGMNKEEKSTFLNRFKSFSSTGAVLLGAISGSFGEGVDLPGELLQGVIVVGLPLSTPTLETKRLIDYYDVKFGKGWDYGYVMPAFQKTIQGAGRCIRTEKDKGVIIFLDERYAQPNYYKNFPADWKIKITREYIRRIEEFYNN
ncbi:ATP-dependent DNA helicase [Candidatus Woesearchaeota archaeon]|jgi:DNA excision repair protein ERCC-2|nr:MAG: ATP-dependent DNA helicase [Candidatus Woesearchaeota archaeon]